MESIIIHMIIGPLMLVISIFFKVFPPKKINDLYGYRTKRSMRSQEAWDYANRISPNLMIMISMLTIGSQLVFASFLSLGPAALYSCVVLVLLLVMMLPFMEKKLKRRFEGDESKNPDTQEAS